ncbi:MAG: hypothetical protein AB7I18_11135 [Candidatus Berkiella sp.]
MSDSFITRLFLMIFLLSNSALAHAYEMPEKIEDVSLDKCEVGNVTGHLRIFSLSKQIPYTNEIAKIARQQADLAAHGKNSKLPIKDLLSKDDLERFEQLNQKLKQLNLITYVESRKQRDYGVIKLMTNLADEEYQTGKLPTEGSLDSYIYMPIVYFSPPNPDDLQVSKPTNNASCNLDLSLYYLQEKIINELGLLNIDLAKSELDSILKKYNIKRITDDNLNKMSVSDRNMVVELRKIFIKYYKGYVYLGRIESIRYMASIIDVNYEAYQKDLLISSGDPLVLGTEMNKILESKKENDPLRVAIRGWRIINEKMPSEVVEQWGLLGTALKNEIKAK